MVIRRILGLGKRAAPAVPLVILAGASRSGRKELINRIVEQFGPETHICVVLYDFHHAEEAIAKAPNVCVHPYVHQAIKCPCHGDGSDPIRKSVRHALQAGGSDVAILQVGRGKNAKEVLKDVVRLGGAVRLAGMTAALNAESALNDLRDADDEVGSYVRAAGQVYLSQTQGVDERTLDAVRKRVAEINPKAVLVEETDRAAQNIRKQIYAALNGRGAQ